jgi:hypothetical protein
MQMRSTYWAGVAALSATLLGCGGGNSSEGVAGKVALDGAPLAGARVVLVPKDRTAPGMKSGPFMAETDAQGAFALMPITGDADGAPPGAYTLTITTAWTKDTSEGAVLPPEKVPPPHSTTGVDFEVPAGGTADANFELKSK